MSDESCGGSGMLWFLAGLGVGTALGVLYAPKPGSETRDSLRNAAGEGRDVMQERARRYREQAQQWAERGKETFSQQKDNLRSAFEAGRQAYREATQTPDPESELGNS